MITGFKIPQGVKTQPLPAVELPIWEFPKFIREKFEKAVLAGLRLPDKWFVTDDQRLYVRFDGFRITDDQFCLLNGEDVVATVSVPDFGLSKGMTLAILPNDGNRAIDGRCRFKIG